MKRILGGTFVLTAAILLGRAQAQGPGSGGAAFRNPFDPQPMGTPVPMPAPRPAAPAPAGPSEVDRLFLQKGGLPGTSNPLPASREPGTPHPLAPRQGPDPNQDVLVRPENGEWLIMIQTYQGPGAPLMARQLVGELRQSYKLDAYAFNFGEEERKAEYERVKAIVEKQREWLRQNNMPLDQPIRVRYTRIPLQVGVLVGGYPTDEEARRALDQIRKLPPPDPTKVQLDKKWFVEFGKDQEGLVAKDKKIVTVNPFERAFICRNPTTKHDRPEEWDKLDIAALRRMNAAEEFSLLKCPKALTLAIKSFQTPTVVQSSSSKGSFLENLGFGKKEERADAAAVSAHNLAELLRKAKLDAYVLHTKYTSVVTVGGYDSLEDPNLRAMQNLLQTRLKLDFVQLFPQPIPMKVPR